MSAIAGARSLPIWQSLRVRDFRLLWASEAISVLGDQFHYVALAWLVIDLTQSGLALGTVLIATGVPRALMLLPFGVLADRRPPRNLMLVAHLARGAIVGALAALVLTDTATLPVLALLGAAFGIADALYIPAQQAFLPRTLAADRLPSANAVLQGTLQLAAIAGPPLAGAFIAMAGTGAAIAVDAASFLVAALVVALISARGGALVAAPRMDGPADAAASVVSPEPGQAGEPHQGLMDAVRDGIRFAVQDPPLRTTLLLALVLNFALNGPGAVGMPWLAEIRFDAGPTGLGLMSAGWAAGALAGTLLAGSLRVRRQGAALLGWVVVAGLAMLAVGLVAWLPAVVAALAVMGLAIGYVNVVAISWIQARVPTGMVGRVMSLVMLMGFGITPLSMGVAGAMLDVAATALFVGSALLVLVVAAGAFLVRYPAAFDRPAARTAAASGLTPGTAPG